MQELLGAAPRHDQKQNQCTPDPVLPRSALLVTSIFFQTTCCPGLATKSICSAGTPDPRLTDAGFKYPMTLSGLGQAFSAFGAFVCCHILKIVPAEKLVDLRFFCMRILPVGLCMAVTLMCGNTVYMYLTVSFIQMLKAFTPVITMFGLFLAALEVRDDTPVGRRVCALCRVPSSAILSMRLRVALWEALSAGHIPSVRYQIVYTSAHLCVPDCLFVQLLKPLMPVIKLSDSSY
jgi:hypothetical protein